MIDYLFQFATEEEALTGLSPIFVVEAPSDREDPESPKVKFLDDSVAFPVTTYTAEAVYEFGEVDPVTGLPSVTLVTPRADIPGYHVWCSTPEVDEVLFEHPNCILAANRESKLILYTKLSMETLVAAKITPVIAGSEYVFGSPQVAQGNN